LPNRNQVDGIAGSADVEGADRMAKAVALTLERSQVQLYVEKGQKKLVASQANTKAAVVS
jgi:hypothetical protein